MSSNIKLGNVVRDLTSGFTGMAVSKLTRMNGNIQYNVQPMMKEGDTTLPEAIALDENTLEVIDQGIADKATTPTYVAPIELGVKVEDIVTKKQGIAAMRCEYINGCAAYLVTSKSNDKKSDMVYQDWTDQCVLRVVDQGVSMDIVKPPVSSNGKQPGGAPMRGVPRF